ncbi:hypothetical protein [Dactylosporangium sp. CA-139066]|uniref:hypothetical protein n=1 Tax=Dactylosporangium sp. CA-139066 TaxID=3239930 RepID=UPI003D8C2C1E
MPAPVPGRPPFSAPPSPNSGRRGGFLVGLTILSVLVSLISTAIAIYSLGVANDAKNASGPAAVTPNAPVNQAAVPTTAAARPTARFAEAWTVSLEIHPPTSGASNIDLDKPEVGADQDSADMQLYVYDGEYFRFGQNVKVVTMNSPDAQPGDCAARFDTARLAPDAQINVKTDNLTLCINTSLADAQRQGIDWKIVLLHVMSVLVDGTVNVSLKAWNVPQ